MHAVMNAMTLENTFQTNTFGYFPPPIKTIVFKTHFS